MPTPAYHPFVRALADGLRKRCAAAEGASLLLAVSGGADSVALLRACVLLAGRRSWHLKLAVVHVHHGVRQEADEEARFVAALAQAHGLPFFQEKLNPAAFGKRNLEEAMREARYGALAKIAKAHGFGAVVTAHHGDDQLETLLLRLCRGCQPEAMAGMAWQRELVPGVRLLRPLLGITHAEALDFLRTLGQAWREDASNNDERQARAKLRLRVIPALKELHPQAAQKAVALADAVREESRRGGAPRFWDSASETTDTHVATTTVRLSRAGERGEPPRLLFRAAARAMSPAHLRLALKNMLHQAGIRRVNSALLAQAAQMAAGPHGKTRTLDLPGKRQLVVTRTEITIRA